MPHGGHPRRRSDLTWTLHRCLMPTSEESLEPARWLEARSSDPEHPCCAGYRAWTTQPAAGFSAALATYNAEANEDPLSLQATQKRRDATVVIPAGQLSEWVLNDLKEEPSEVQG